MLAKFAVSTIAGGIPCLAAAIVALVSGVIRLTSKGESLAIGSGDLWQTIIGGSLGTRYSVSAWAR